MPVYLKNSVFVHIPKTGGVWVERALMNCATVTKGNESIHHGHIMPDVDDNTIVFAFARHPVTWLRSLFYQRRRKRWNWQTYLRLEKECQAKDLFNFFEKVSKAENVVDDYYNHYIGKYAAKDNFFIGKTEDICDGLISFLKKFEEDFDEQGIRQRCSKKENPCRSQPAKIPDKFYDMIYESQKGFYDKYGYTKKS